MPESLNAFDNPVSVYVVPYSILKIVAAPHSFRNYMQGIMTNTKEPPSSKAPNTRHLRQRVHSKGSKGTMKLLVSLIHIPVCEELHNRRISYL